MTKARNAPDKRQTRALLGTMAIAWQREVAVNGDGPQADYYRAQLLGGLAVYREAFGIRDITLPDLMESYRQWAEGGVDYPVRTVTPVPLEDANAEKEPPFIRYLGS